MRRAQSSSVSAPAFSAARRTRRRRRCRSQAKERRPRWNSICGPLCTWRTKTRKPLHSFIASAKNEHYQEILDRLDASLEDALGPLRENLDAPGLKVAFGLPFHVTDLIAIGGEAAGHPKHFAYFLPEDEGVDDLPLREQRTLYLRNVHMERYSLITIPLAETLIKGPVRAEDVPIESTLMPWIRGHDHGHNLVVPETKYDWIEQLGVEPFYMLGEAIADVYGFLLLTSEAWLEIAGASRADMCATHIAELLHYLRRGPWHDGDAGAAYVELSFLAENGFVDIDEAGRITWTEDGFHAGMVELAKALTESTVSAQGPGPSREFIDRYGWPEDVSEQALDTLAGHTLAAMREEPALAYLPTSLAFYRTDAPSSNAS